MAVIFLTIVTHNLPFPINIITRPLILAPIWLVLLLIYKSQIIFSKYLVSIYFFFLLLFLGSLIFWNDRTIMLGSKITLKWIIIDLYGLFLPILMYLYYISEKDFKGIAIVTSFSLAFIFITAVTSIFGITVYPSAVRELASGGQGNNVMYYKMGIADYSYFAGIVFIFPGLFYLLREKSLNYKNKILLTFSFAILQYSLLLAEFTTALIIATSSSLYSFITPKKSKSSFLSFIILTFIGLFIFKGYVAELFYSIASLTDSPGLKFRLSDIGDFILLGEYKAGSSKTYFSESRLSLIRMSIDKFIENPLIGGGWGGGHSTWFDRLGLFGIFGFVPWVYIFRQQIKLNLANFNNAFSTYYLISFYSCLFLGSLTTMANSLHSGAVLFFILPGIFFLDNLFEK